MLEAQWCGSWAKEQKEEHEAAAIEEGADIDIGNEYPRAPRMENPPSSKRSVAGETPE
jgi:hypothetical protein